MFLPATFQWTGWMVLSPSLCLLWRQSFNPTPWRIRRSSLQRMQESSIDCDIELLLNDPGFIMWSLTLYKMSFRILQVYSVWYFGWCLNYTDNTMVAFVYGSWTLILLIHVTYMYYSNHAVCPTHWYSWLRISALCQLMMHWYGLNLANNLFQ